MSMHVNETDLSMLIHESRCVLSDLENEMIDTETKLTALTRKRDRVIATLAKFERVQAGQAELTVSDERDGE